MTTRSLSRAVPWIAALVLALGAAGAAQAQWQMQSADGETSIKFGFLAQMRADSVETASGEDSQNLYFRRLRLLWGGKLGGKWSFFFETDSPNLGKADSKGVKSSGDVYIQDFVVSYDQSPTFHVDAGLLLPAQSRNHNQSAATLLASDYGPYSFLESGVTTSNVGRDYGVRIRGSAADNHLEYRLGVYDGFRGVNAAESFRYAGRIAYNFFDTETGLFYTGNNLGGKRQLAIGVGFDKQDDYSMNGFDLFWDQPVGEKGGAFTLQLDSIAYDGGDFLTGLPKQDTLLLEAGYLIGGTKWQPWIQFADRDFDNPATADQSQRWFGVNYRILKHNRILRLAYGQLETDGGDTLDAIQVTLQILHY